MQDPLSFEHQYQKPVLVRFILGIVLVYVPFKTTVLPSSTEIIREAHSRFIRICPLYLSVSFICHSLSFVRTVDWVLEMELIKKWSSHLRPALTYKPTCALICVCINEACGQMQMFRDSKAGISYIVLTVIFSNKCQYMSFHSPTVQKHACRGE